MSKNVIILRALPWGRDSRMERWERIYKRRKVLFGIWGRSSLQNVYSITKIIRKPSNKFLIGIGYIWFSLMAFVFVMRYAKKNDVIVFMDLETILFACMAAKIKKSIIHYDMVDPFYMVKPVPVKFFWKSLEKLFIKNASIVTAPHISRFELFVKKITPNMQVVENVPLFKNSIVIKQKKVIKNNIVIGYFGGLEAKYRGLESLVDMVMKDDNFLLIVAGSGELFDDFVKYSQKCKRIFFKGEFKQDDLPLLMEKIDVYFAYYSDEKPLHLVAAPNKFYEHLFFGKPIITSCCIPQAFFIQKYDTGWCIVNDKDALVKWKNHLLSMHMQEWDKFFFNCRKLWHKKYKNYYNTIDFRFSF